MVDYDNRTDKTPIVWGPVIGLKEEFTFMEILQFPIFVLRNHGSDWNEVGITYWILLGLGLATAVFWVAWKCFRKTLAQSKTLRVRYGLYHLALVGFGAAGIEQLIHLVIAPARKETPPRGWTPRGLSRFSFVWSNVPALLAKAAPRYS